MQEPHDSQTAEPKSRRVRVMSLAQSRDIDLDEAARLTVAQRVELMEHLRRQWYGDKAVHARVQRVVQVFEQPPR